MSKKHKKSIPVVVVPMDEGKAIINMNKINLMKAYTVPSFKTGRHMTEKDRPRKKNWKKESDLLPS